MLGDFDAQYRNLFFAPGTRVEFVDPVARVGAEFATVIGVTLREHGAAGYEVAWWTGGERRTARVEPGEITAPRTALRTLRAVAG